MLTLTFKFVPTDMVLAIIHHQKKLIEAKVTSPNSEVTSRSFESTRWWIWLVRGIDKSNGKRYNCF
jgi:hypothetical protein